MNIIFSDGSSMSVSGVHGHSQYLEGVTRDFLTFLFPEDTPLDAIKSKFTPENMRAFRLDDGESVSEHYNYTIPVAFGAGIKDHVLNNQIGSGERAAYAVMAQTTTGERKLLELQSCVDAMLVSELGEG